MKRPYLKPTLETIILSMEQSLLQSSISVASENFGDNMMQLSKENKGFDLWGDDEE